MPRSALPPIRLLAVVFLLSALPLPAEVSTQGTTQVDADETPARVLVFVDDVFSIETRRDAVLRRLAEQIGELGPGDTMAIAAWDGEGVTMLVSWTRDEAELEAALERARERRAYGLLRRSEWARLDSLDDRGRRSFGGSSFSSIGFHGSRRDLRSRPTPAVAEHVRRLAAAASSVFAKPVPATGRRAMLLLSGGLPPAIGPDALDAVADAARRRGWAVYPVDLGAALVTHSPDPDPSGVLASLAERTGGVPYLDGRRFTALGRALAHLRSEVADSRSSTSP